MLSALRRFVDWMFVDRDLERENYFAKAADVADLERRIRSWERNRRPFGRVSL